MPNKPTEYYVIEDVALDTADAVISSTDRCLYAGDLKLFKFNRIDPAPKTYRVAYAAGTANVKTLTVGSGASDSAGNSIDYTVRINETNPYTGEVNTQSFTYTTAATGTPDSEDVATALRTAAAGNTYGWTIGGSTNTLSVTGTVNGGAINIVLNVGSGGLTTSSVANTTPYVSPKGTALETAFLAERNGLTFNYTTYNKIVISGDEESNDGTLVKKEKVLMIYQGDASLVNFYNAIIALLRGDYIYAIA